MKTKKTTGSGYAQRGECCGAHATLMALHKLGKGPKTITPTSWHSEVDKLWPLLMCKTSDGKHLGALAGMQNCNPVAIVRELRNRGLSSSIYATLKSESAASGFKGPVDLTSILKEVRLLASREKPAVQVKDEEGLVAILEKETQGYAVTVCFSRELGGLHYVLAGKKLAKKKIETYDSNCGQLKWYEMPALPKSFGDKIETEMTRLGNYTLVYLGLTIVLEKTPNGRRR